MSKIYTLKNEQNKVVQHKKLSYNNFLQELVVLGTRLIQCAAYPLLVFFCVC